MGERVENPSLVIFSLFGDEDTWIHETVRVESAFDGTEQGKPTVTELGPQPFAPDTTDPVVVRDTTVKVPVTGSILKVVRLPTAEM